MSSCFFLDSRANKQREHAIRVVISINGGKCTTTLGYTVNKEVWESERLQDYVNSKGASGADIKQKMKQLQEGMRQWEQRLRGRRPSVPEIRDRMKRILSGGELERSAPVDVVHLVDAFITEQSSLNQWSAGTVALLKSFRRHLSRLCPTGTDVDFFDQPGLETWLRYLRESARMEESTVRKMYMELHWFLNWALRKEYLHETAVLRFKPKFKLVPKPVIYLTKRELLTLYNYKVPRNGTAVVLADASGNRYTKVVRHASALERARDLFCFCAFTSLRYSDMSRLRRSNVTHEILCVTSQKTHDRLPIEICTKAREILDKYQHCTFADDRVLPVLSCQKMNLYLKELCELCGIKSPVVKVLYRGGVRQERVYPKYALVGTHAARRTFICFALSQGIPPQVVMKWTGHADYQSMRPYIDVASGVTSAAMRKLSAAWK